MLAPSGRSGRPAPSGRAPGPATVDSDQAALRRQRLLAERAAASSADGAVPEDLLLLCFVVFCIFFAKTDFSFFFKGGGETVSPLSYRASGGDAALRHVRAPHAHRPRPLLFSTVQGREGGADSPGTHTYIYIYTYA